MAETSKLLSIINRDMWVKIISAIFVVPPLSVSASAKQDKLPEISAQADCEMQMGGERATKGQLKAFDWTDVSLRCGPETYEIGPAKQVSGAFHQKSASRLMLLDTPSGQKMIIFQKPNLKSTGKAKRFGQYEVIELDLRRAIVNLNAFEERGAVMIWRRGGP